MLGSPRTGSTWLLNLLRISPDVLSSDEPGIGYHLGLFGADVMGPHPAEFDRAGPLLPAGRAGDPDYFFSTHYESVWREPLRQLVLDRFGAQLAEHRERGPRFLIIKEPAGSQAAPFLFSLFPHSRLLFLLRDGRDVVDSELDAVRRGAWLANHFEVQEEMTAGERLGLLRAQAHRWVRRTELVRQVFDALPADQRLLVRYETLLADTLTETTRIFGWLGVDADRDQLAAHIDRLSFATLPAPLKGPGKFARSAAPGAWRLNLRPEEQRMLDEIMGAALADAGYRSAAD
jgi:hypothetical protein